jgi:hypothetical protein
LRGPGACAAAAPGVGGGGGEAVGVGSVICVQEGMESRSTHTRTKVRGPVGSAVCTWPDADVALRLGDTVLNGDHRNHSVLAGVGEGPTAVQHHNTTTMQHTAHTKVGVVATGEVASCRPKTSAQNK